MWLLVALALLLQSQPQNVLAQDTLDEFDEDADVTFNDMPSPRVGSVVLPLLLKELKWAIWYNYVYMLKRSMAQ